MISFVAVWYLFPETKGLSLEEMGSVFDDKSSIFSYHGSGSVGGSSGSIYGSTDNGSGRRPSVNEPIPAAEPIHQSAASMARNPGTAQPHLDGIITGAAPPPIRPVKSDVGDVASFDGSNAGSNTDIVQEIEPPSLEQIIKFKAEEQAQPNILVSAFHSLFGKKDSHTNDEESRLLG
jgi:hypothetical protein